MPDFPIRNFCIIAHIDHGKSTLADRLLERTGAITQREMESQFLDDMDLERERGITIKASAVSVFYTHPDTGVKYLFNLIDTPGHVDFHYEVAKALQACEGALLLCDATQGVQAQTVANAFAAIDQNLEIIPVINKIDLPSARPDDVAEEMEQVLGIDALMCAPISAKTGQGVDGLLKLIADKLPAPKGRTDAPLQCLIFDSKYDDYRGVIVYVRVIHGSLTVGQKIRMMGADKLFIVTDLGKFMPKPTKVPKIDAGEVGFLVANIKTIQDVTIGDTITDAALPATEALPGYRPPKQMVFCDFYPGDKTEYTDLRDALEKLRLNDSSFTFEPETSDALGFGFRCGFLGLLHMEIVQERLEREHKIEVIQTAPTVPYEVVLADGSVITIDSASELPDPSKFTAIREPMIKASIIVPAKNIGDVTQLCIDRRGIYKKTEFITTDRVILEYEMPLAEVIFDFFDKLKTATQGYGTLDYDLIGFHEDDLAKMDILVAGDKISALSLIVHRSKAEQRGRAIIKKLRKEIDRHLFEVALQAAIGSRVIARETISALRKDVTSKCYGGDISRKRKLLEKQKEGKKRMKQVGRVEIPQKAFMAILESGDQAVLHCGFSLRHRVVLSYACASGACMIPILIQKPPITHRQKKIAVSIAGAVDLLQIAVFPFLFPGWAVDDALDVIAALVLVAICGFKWQFIAVFVLELVPGLDLFPTWTALALTLPSAGPIPVESTSNSPVIGATRVPPVQHPTLPSTTTNP